MKQKIFERDVNPSSERLRAKLSDLEAHQTPNTAMAFYNTIIEIFLQERIRLRRPLVLPGIFYSLTFLDSYEKFAFVCEGIFYGPGTTASFGVIDENDSNKVRQSYAVCTLPARRIAGLKQDIDLGRIKSTERMPIRVVINDRRYPIIYRNAIVNPFEAGVS